MPAYPTLPIATKVVPVNALKTDISDSGDVRAIDLSAQNVYRLDITHPLLDATERNTLTSFYTTNKGVVVTVTAGDGNTYDCLITREPTITVVTPIRFTAKITLVGNRN